MMVRQDHGSNDIRRAPRPRGLARCSVQVGCLTAGEGWLLLASSCQTPSLTAHAVGGHSGEQRVSTQAANVTKNVDKHTLNAIDVAYLIGVARVLAPRVCVVPLLILCM